MSNIATRDPCDGCSPEALSFEGPNPDARWVALGGKDVSAHWRQGQAYSTCKVQHVISDMQAQIDAVKAGLGFGYLPCFVADADPGLTRLAGSNPQYIPARVLTHPDLNTTEHVRICTRFIADAVWRMNRKMLGEG